MRNNIFCSGVKNMLCSCNINSNKMLFEKTREHCICNNRCIRHFNTIGLDEEDEREWDEDNIPYELQCPICKKPPSDPVQYNWIINNCPCLKNKFFCITHFFTMFQLDKPIIERTEKNCLCNAITINTVSLNRSCFKRSKIVNELLDILKIKPQCQECNIEFENQNEYREHMKNDCPFVILPCPNIYCDTYIQRRNLDEHMMNEHINNQSENVNNFTLNYNNFTLDTPPNTVNDEDEYRFDTIERNNSRYIQICHSMLSTTVVPCRICSRNIYIYDFIRHVNNHLRRFEMFNLDV